MVAVAALALLLGFAGAKLIQKDPDLQLAEARATIEAQDQAIAERDGRIALLEAQLARIGGDGLARLERALAERETVLDAREQQLADRAAAVAQREEAVSGRIALPRIELPTLEEVRAFSARVSDWVGSTVGADNALDSATQKGLNSPTVEH